MSNQINVVATIIVKKDFIEFVKNELLKLILPTQKENGFVKYDLHQSIDQPEIFVFYEEWLSRELLDTHLKSHHIYEYMANVEGKIDFFELKILKKLNKN